VLGTTAGFDWVIAINVKMLRGMLAMVSRHGR